MSKIRRRRKEYKLVRGKVQGKRDETEKWDQRKK